MEGMLPASSLLSRPASTIYNTISDLRGGGIPWFRPHLCGKIDINFKKAKYRKTNSVRWGLLIQHLVFSVVPSGLPPVGGSSCHRQAWYMWPHGNCPHIQIQSFRDKRDENTCLENWKKDAQKKYNAETCWKATRNSRQVRRIPHLSSLLERVPLLCMVDHIELCIGDHPLVRISNQQNISLKIYDIIQPEKKNRTWGLDEIGITVVALQPVHQFLLKVVWSHTFRQHLCHAHRVEEIHPEAQLERQLTDPFTT